MNVGRKFRRKVFVCPIEGGADFVKYVRRPNTQRTGPPLISAAVPFMAGVVSTVLGLWMSTLVLL